MKLLVELEEEQLHVTCRALSVAGRMASYQAILNGKTDDETAGAYASVRNWLLEGAMVIEKELDATALGNGREQKNYLLRRDEAVLQKEKKQ